MFRRLLPTLSALVLGLAGLGWGLWQLQRIFATEREDARASLRSRREALEQYALVSLSQTLREKLEEKGVVVQTLLLFSDDIARAILNIAVDRGTTLNALGLTGKNVFARLLAGNVPVELIKNTKVPVLLLPPDHKGNI